MSKFSSSFLIKLRYTKILPVSEHSQFFGTKKNYYFNVQSQDAKNNILKKILQENSSKQTVMYASLMNARNISEFLQKENFPVFSIFVSIFADHLTNFMKGPQYVDAATSKSIVLNQDYLSHKLLSFDTKVVVNYDLPLRAEKFAHRSARYSEGTASNMVAFTFINLQDPKEAAFVTQRQIPEAPANWQDLLK
jgi:superfamily II DNA/RNA helicase